MSECRPCEISGCQASDDFFIPPPPVPPPGVYDQVVVCNLEQTATCPEGETGDPVTIAAGVYCRTLFFLHDTPQAERDPVIAENQAQLNAIALAAAEALLECEPAGIPVLFRMPVDETAPPIPLTTGGMALAVNGTTLYLCQFAPTRFYSSPDGTTWTLESVLPHIPSCLAFGAGIYAIGRSDAVGSFLSSPDAVNWTVRNSTSGDTVAGILFANGQFIAVTSFGDSLTSPDGIVWTQTLGLPPAVYGTNGPRPLAFGAGLYCAVGSGGVIATSPDGITWTAQVSGTGAQLSGIAFGSGQFVVVGNGGTVLTSPDGLVWTDQTIAAGITDDMTCLDFGFGWFWAGTFQDTAYRSIDGITWHQDTFVEPDLFKDLKFFKGNVFVALLNLPV